MDDLLAADFDIYAYEGALYYLSDDCPPPAPSRAELRVFLHFFPDDTADLPEYSREHGFENRDFWFGEHAAFFDGKCVNRQILPDYPIARIATGAHMEGKAVWRANINLATQALYERIAAGHYGQPVAQSDFDLYLSGNSLAYLKDPSLEGAAAARFLLHIIPADPASLPANRREYGFENLNFQFADHGARIGDICVIERELPAYPIARIRAGQFVSGGGWLWRTEFPAAR